MAVGSGISGQMVYKPETTYGVAPSLASNQPLEIKSETLELRKTTVQGEGLHAGGLYPRTKRRVLTNYAVQGGIVMDLPTRFIGNLIQGMVGSYGYTLATPAQVGVSGIYKSVHWPVSGGLQGHSLCFQKGVPAVDGTVMPHTFVGCKISDWEIAVQSGAIAQLTLNIDGRHELSDAGVADPLNASPPTLATFNSTPGSGQDLSVFHFRQGTIFTGGAPTVASNAVSLSGTTALGNVKSANVKHAVSLDTSRYFIGSSGFKAEQIENGFRQISGELVVEFTSGQALYDAFAEDTTTSLQLTLTGATVSTSNYLLDIIIPNIKLEGETPKIPGPAVIDLACSFSGADDEATTPIQITYQTEDTTL